jgi:hypothetical protein
VERRLRTAALRSGEIRPRRLAARINAAAKASSSHDGTNSPSSPDETMWGTPLTSVAITGTPATRLSIKQTGDPIKGEQAGNIHITEDFGADRESNRRIALDRKFPDHV